MIESHEKPDTIEGERLNLTQLTSMQIEVLVMELMNHAVEKLMEIGMFSIQG